MKTIRNTNEFNQEENDDSTRKKRGLIKVRYTKKLRKTWRKVEQLRRSKLNRHVNR